jgi:hypothetical protein
MGKAEVTSPQWRDKCKERYGFDPLEPIKETGKLRTGEDMVFEVADTVCRGNVEDASRKIMQDFRAGRMGPICLQLAPSSETDDGQQKVTIDGRTTSMEGKLQREEERQEERQERARAALETAKQKGLELPPIIQNETRDSSSKEIGKGLFDGW